MFRRDSKALLKRLWHPVLLHTRCPLLRFFPPIHYSQHRLNHTAIDSISSHKLLHNLFPTCDSCGIKLQDTDSKAPGYYQLPSPTKSTPKTPKKEDVVFQKYLSQLSAEDQALLMNTDESEPAIHEIESLGTVLNQQRELAKQNAPDRVSCVRCRHATHQSDFKDLSVDDYPVEHFDSIMKTIPPNGKLVYVVSAQDFPMSLNDQVFKYRRPDEIQFLITKNDLLFPTPQLADRYGLTFYRDFLWRKHRVNPEQVTIASGLNDWNIKGLAKSIQNDSFFIGHVNSGKSTIIQSLLYLMEELKQEKLSKRPNRRQKRQLEKLEDRSIAMGRYKQLKQTRQSVEKYKLMHGPGSSYMPGFTRGNIPYQLNDSVTIYDVPGFTNNVDNQHGVYDLIAPRSVKLLTKGVKVHEKGIYKSKYETIRDGQIYSVGGLLALQAPCESSHTMLQVRNCINSKATVFNNFSKFMSIVDGLEGNESMKTKFLVGHSGVIPNYERFLIPPFHGSVDVVVKNLGHINITATGSKSANDQPLVLYLPRKVEAVIRQPITSYIMKTLAGKDAKGNPLRKENWVKKSVAELRRYTGKAPFFSRLIPAHAKSDDVSDLEYVKDYIKTVKGNYNEDEEGQNWLEL